MLITYITECTVFYANGDAHKMCSLVEVCVKWVIFVQKNVTEIYFIPPSPISFLPFHLQSKHTVTKSECKMQT